MAVKGEKVSAISIARQAVSARETGMRKMRARHADELARKEQELLAARARLELLERGIA